MKFVAFGFNYLTNMQNDYHNTVTKELTQYAYFYEITGLHKYDQSIRAIGAEGGANLNTVFSWGTLIEAGIITDVGTAIID